MIGCSNGGEPSDCALLNVTATVGRLSQTFQKKHTAINSYPEAQQVRTCKKLGNVYHINKVELPPRKAQSTKSNVVQFSALFSDAVDCVGGG
jgi:hypothetical protein